MTTYYTPTHTFPDDTLAKGTDVYSEFQSVQSAFVSVDAAINNLDSSVTLYNKLHLGAKSSAPSVDNSGGALQTGADYFDTTTNRIGVWNGSSWVYDSLDAYNSKVAAAASASAASSSASAASNSASAAAASAASISGAGYAPLANPSFTGAATFAGTITSSDITTKRTGALTTGYIYFGNSGTKYMGYDGTNVTVQGGDLLTGGGIITNGNVKATGGNFYAGHHTAASGTYYFGNNSTKSLGCDGTSYTFASGTVFATAFNANSTDISTTIPTRVAVETSSDNTLRWQTIANFFNKLGQTLHLNADRGRVLRETNNGTLVAGSIYNIYTGGGAITMLLPTMANSTNGDTITFADVNLAWATNNFTISCANDPTHIVIANLTIGESLVCDRSGVKFTLTCCKDVGVAVWAIG